jgi:hypothetical protein
MCLSLCGNCFAEGLPCALFVDPPHNLGWDSQRGVTAFSPSGPAEFQDSWFILKKSADRILVDAPYGRQFSWCDVPLERGDTSGVVIADGRE